MNELSFFLLTVCCVQYQLGTRPAHVPDQGLETEKQSTRSRCGKFPHNVALRLRSDLLNTAVSIAQVTVVMVNLDVLLSVLDGSGRPGP